MQQHAKHEKSQSAKEIFSVDMTRWKWNDLTLAAEAKAAPSLVKSENGTKSMHD